MGIEKRRFRRLETDIPAAIRTLGAEGPPGPALNVRITNLGPEGAYVQCDQLLPVQNDVLLDFRLDSYPEEFNIRARILWRRDVADERGMGMQFATLSIFEKNVIIDYILRRYAEFQLGQRA